VIPEVWDGDDMNSCTVCGTALTPGLAWCRQCLSPVANMRPDRSYRRTSERPADPVITIRGGRVAGADAAGDLVMMPPSTTVGFRPVAARTPVRAAARELELSPVTKSIVTALVLAVGVGVFLGLEGFRDELGDLTGAIELVILGGYAILAAVVLWSTWRSRPPSRLARQHDLPPALHAMPRPDVVRIDDGSVNGSVNGPTDGRSTHDAGRP
jgi:hypothetical protein